jgi:hypothetical protein
MKGRFFMAKSKILTPAGSTYDSGLTLVGGSLVPKVAGVRPCGSQVLIEFLTSQELLGTTLSVGEKIDLKVPMQGYVRCVGPNFKSEDYGFNIGDRVTVSGSGVHVPNWDDSHRDRFLMEPYSVKGVIIEA